MSLFSLTSQQWIAFSCVLLALDVLIAGLRGRTSSTLATAQTLIWLFAGLCSMAFMAVTSFTLTTSLFLLKISMISKPKFMDRLSN